MKKCAYQGSVEHNKIVNCKFDGSRKTIGETCDERFCAHYRPPLRERFIDWLIRVLGG
jgi:hypothetical protein